MAVNNRHAPVDQVTLVVEDQTTPTAKTHTVGNLELGSITPPVSDSRAAKEEILVNSASGASRYAVTTMGVAPGQTFTFQFVETDTENNTDVNSVSLFRGLEKNSLSGTGFATASWDVTSNLTGGGGAEVVLAMTFNLIETGTFVVRIPVEVQGGGVRRVASGKHFAIEVECLVVGAITVT